VFYLQALALFLGQLFVVGEFCHQLRDYWTELGFELRECGVGVFDGVVQSVALANYDPSMARGSSSMNSRSMSNDGGKSFQVDVRVDTPQEVEYFRSGGILPYVLRQLAG